VMGKATGIAAALVRGVTFEAGTGRASELVRNPAEDMFR
jgi:F420-0:gamma-glutamyl ligase